MSRPTLRARISDDDGTTVDSERVTAGGVVEIVSERGGLVGFADLDRLFGTVGAERERLERWLPAAPDRGEPARARRGRTPRGAEGNHSPHPRRRCAELEGVERVVAGLELMLHPAERPQTALVAVTFTDG